MSRFFAPLLLALTLSCSPILLSGCGGGGGGSSSNSDPSLPRLSSPISLRDGHQQGETFFPAPTTSGADIGSLGCGAMDETYHIHSSLTIFLNGRQLAVPAAIGIKNPRFQTKSEWPDGFAIFGDCHYNIHTHDTSGKLHAEAPAPRRFTLGQAFAIWNQPLSRSNVAGLTGLPIDALIKDGNNYRRYVGDLADIELVSQREITIIVGTPPARVPTYFWFAP